MNGYELFFFLLFPLVLRVPFVTTNYQLKISFFLRRSLVAVFNGFLSNCSLINP